MTAGIARAVTMAPARTCRDCGCWPCLCKAALRIEPCACGGPAIASGGPAENVRAAVERHQRTPEHQAMRERWVAGQ